MKILIAVPTYETITPDTFQSIYDLNKGGHECIFRYVRGYDVATARNRIAQLALDLQTDWLFMVDNDIVLPEDVLLWLLEDAKDVQLGYYPHRGAKNLYTGQSSICRLGWFNYPMESAFTDKHFAELRKKGEVKVQIHGGGMGCALNRTDLFRKLSYPWFDWVNYAGKNRGMLSEDLYFCELCRKAKIPVYTDIRASCGHQLRRVYWME